MPVQYAFPHTDADERRRLDLLQQDLDPITHGAHNFRQNAQSRRNAVELATAVIRND